MAVTIVSLHVYPLKSGAGLSVDRWPLDATGLVHDRRFVVVDANTKVFLTQRDLPQLAQIGVRVDAARATLHVPGHAALPLDDPHATPRRVRVWKDEIDALDEGDTVAAVLTSVLARPVRIVRFNPKNPRPVDATWTGEVTATTQFSDMAPVLVASVASLAALNQRREAARLIALPMSRFRPNIVVDGLDAFEEDGVDSLWVSPSTRLAFIKPCPRCVLTEVDQVTGIKRDDQVLKSLAFRTMENRAGERGIMFGQNAIVVGEAPVELAVGMALSRTEIAVARG